jgi:membrane protein YqaA with SNARE-associated domain
MIKTLIILLTALILLFFAVLSSTVVGGVVGWVVGAFFPVVIDTVNKLAGTELSSFEVGAVLGFVGAFFRTTITK